MTDVIDAEVVSETVEFVPEEPDLPFGKSRFGWCNDGHHAPTETSAGCPGTIYPRRHPDPARKGTFYTLPGRRCPCPCHQRDFGLD